MRRATIAVVDKLRPKPTANTSVSSDSVRPTVATASAPRRPTQKTSTTANSDSSTISRTIGIVAAIDGTVNGIAHGATAIGDGVRHSQSGNTRSYAVWVVVGAIIVLAVLFFWPSASKTAGGMVR